jgi:hypothetical protein
MFWSVFWGGLCGMVWNIMFGWIVVPGVWLRMEMTVSIR